MTYDPNRPLAPTATEREFDRNADKARSAIDTTADKANNLASQASDKVSQATDAIGDKVNELKQTEAGQKATQVASDVKDKATQVAGQAAERADEATTTAGVKLQDAATLLREKAPTDGAVGQAAAATADTLQKAGSYLEQQDIAGMRGDLESLIRNHPTESLLIAFGAGFLLARSTRR